MTLDEFNQLPAEELQRHLTNCCGSPKWVKLMMEQVPFADGATLISMAQSAWYKECNPGDWLEAFKHHPRIGDKKNTREEVKDSLHIAVNEQAGVEEGDTTTLHQLHNANLEYEAKSGFTFIVCATGKSGADMLQLINDRIRNSSTEEMHIAMGEQCKITALRLKKLLDEVSFPESQSHITTHILDTSLGKPAADVAVSLFGLVNHGWQKMAYGRTNADGRLPDMLPAGLTLDANHYKLIFETGAYFSSQGQNSFYPEVQITFNIADESHYHVPLLLNPFGYSTYRGS